MAPYSMDLRIRVLKAWDSGLDAERVAARYEVSRAWVHRLVQRRRETGSIAPRQADEVSVPRVGPGQEERLVALITAQPDATLAELREALPTTAALSTLWRDDRPVGLDRQKKRYTPTNSAGLMSRRRGASGATWQPLRDVRPVRVSRRMRRDDRSAAALRPEPAWARGSAITRRAAIGRRTR